MSALGLRPVPSSEAYNLGMFNRERTSIADELKCGQLVARRELLPQARSKFSREEGSLVQIYKLINKAKYDNRMEKVASNLFLEYSLKADDISQYIDLGLKITGIDKYTIGKIHTKHSEQPRIEEFKDSLKGYLYSFEITQRLSELMDDSDLEEEEPISVGSIRQFIGFIRTYSDSKLPNIYASYEGNIQAEWYESDNRLFNIEFFPNGDCKYLIFAPNTRHPKKTVKHVAHATVDTVIEYSNSFGVRKLITDDSYT